MASEEQQESWKRTQAHLRGALAAIEISRPARSWIEEYLAHNELGLAFQTMVETLDVEEEVVPSEVRDLLDAAAEEMELQDDAAWRRVRNR